jgi:hypothetical protein
LTQIWIRHATLLPKKEKYLNMSAPPPRAQETSRLATRVERDDDGPRGSD